MYFFLFVDEGFVFGFSVFHAFFEFFFSDSSELFVEDLVLSHSEDDILKYFGLHFGIFEFLFGFGHSLFSFFESVFELFSSNLLG